MRKFFGALAISILVCAGNAAACPPNTASSAPVFAQLPPWSSIYYCAASPAPQTVGDLSYAGWAKHVQVCNRMCSYEAINPNDPYSPLIQTGCGPGIHPATYYVEPPRTPAASYSSIKLKNPSCSDMAPPKGPAPATPSPRP